MNVDDYHKFIKPAAFKALENMKDGQIFSTTDFKNLVAALCPKAEHSLPSSIIRPLWDYRKSSNKLCSFYCINADKGVYKKCSLKEWDKYEELFKTQTEERKIKSALRLLRSYGYKISM